MKRLVALIAALPLAAPAPARADAFDRYVNPVLAAAPDAEGVKEVKRLTPDLIADNDRVLPNAAAALVIVRTNEGRFGKLLVQAGRQRLRGKLLPILFIERFVTYKEGQERAVQAAGQNVRLFDGFHFDLDLGQVVPPALGGDLRFAAGAGPVYAEPLGKARLFLVTRPLAAAAPKKSDRPTVGDTFETRFFDGTYKLHDDGRRSGTLTLHVDGEGEVTGVYASDADGRKYPVTGKVGPPPHAIRFTVKFPRTQQVFQGWLFTGDARALTGSSRLQDRETGFYALRVED
jgi:hypothetical protein